MVPAIGTLLVKVVCGNVVGGVGGVAPVHGDFVTDEYVGAQERSVPHTDIHRLDFYAISQAVVGRRLGAPQNVSTIQCASLDPAHCERLAKYLSSALQRRLGPPLQTMAVLDRGTERRESAFRLQCRVRSRSKRSARTGDARMERFVPLGCARYLQRRIIFVPLARIRCGSVDRIYRLRGKLLPRLFSPVTVPPLPPPLLANNKLA